MYLDLIKILSLLLLFLLFFFCTLLSLYKWLFIKIYNNFINIKYFITVTNLGDTNKINLTIEVT